MRGVFENSNGGPIWEAAAIRVTEKSGLLTYTGRTLNP